MSDGFEIGDDIRTFLKTITELTDEVGDRIHEESVPQYVIENECKPEDCPSYIWYRLDGTETDDCLSSPVGKPPDILSYTIECFSIKLTQLKTISRVLRENLEGYCGVFGEAHVTDIIVQDVDASYIPRGLFSDGGFFNRAFQLDIYPA